MSGSKRKALMGVASVVTLILLVALIVPLFIDWNKYRSEISTIISDNTGLNVDLTGEITASFFPSPQVKVKSIIMRASDNEDEAGTTIAKVASISITLDGGDLISGVITPSDLSLKGLDIVLTEDESGTWGLKGYVPPVEKVKDDNEADTTVTPFSLTTHLNLRKSQILFQPHKAEPFALVIDKLRVDGTIPNGPVDISSTVLLRDVPLKIVGKIQPVHGKDDLSARLEVKLPSGKVEFSGRLNEDMQLNNGRIVFSGKSLGTAINSIMVLANSSTQVFGGKHAFAFDTQVERTDTGYSVNARRLQLADTKGTATVTYNRAEGENRAAFDSVIRIGVLDVDLWSDMKFISPEIRQDVDQSDATVKSPEPLVIPLLGKVTLSIEGIKYRESQIQQVESTISILPNRIGLESAKALLPGGSQFTTSGSYILKNSHFSGKFDFKSANPRKLLQWQGIEIPSTLAEGRLSTLALKSSAFSINQTDFRLGQLFAKVDAIPLSGDVRGDLTTGKLTKLHLKIGDVNLDSYLAANDEPTTDPIIPMVLMGLDTLGADANIQLKSLHTANQTLKNIIVQTQASDRTVNVQKISARVGKKATLKIVGKIDKSDEAGSTIADTDLTIDLVAFTLRDFVKIPALKPLKPVTGKIVIAGPLGDMRIKGDFKERRGSISMSGRLGLDDITPVFYDMQGKITHDDLRPFIRQATGQKLRKPMNVDLILAVAKAVDKKKSQIHTTGTVWGGQINSKVVVGDTLDSVEFTFDHKELKGLMPPEVKALLVSEKTLAGAVGFKLTNRGGTYVISNANFNVGKTGVKGSLKISPDNRFSGNLVARNWHINPSHKKGRAPSKAPYNESYTPAIFGQVSLKLLNSNIYSQNINTRKANLKLDGHTYHLTMDDADLNGKPLTADIKATIGKTMNFDGTLKADNLDVGGLLKVMDYTSVVKGRFKADIALTGSGATQEELMKSVNGRGLVSGQGGVLNFVNPMKLMSDIKSASTVTGFLSGLKGSLSEGETPADNFTFRFTMNDGVMLVEEFLSQGDWGKLSLDGQIHPANNTMALKGGLDLKGVKDIPHIPVDYSGLIYAPQSNWKTDALQKIMQSEVTRKLRTSLGKKLTGGSEGDSGGPAGSVFKRAIGSLTKKKDAAEKAQMLVTKKPSGQMPKPKAAKTAAEKAAAKKKRQKKKKAAAKKAAAKKAAAKKEGDS